MLNKILQKRKIIFVAYLVISLVLWTLTLIFGNSADKVMVLVLSLILPFVVYGFVRLMYKVVGSNASFKAMRIFFGFFLIAGTLGTVMMIVEYVSGFPNGLSSTLGACGGLIMATLDKAKENIEVQSEE